MFNFSSPFTIPLLLAAGLSILVHLLITRRPGAAGSPFLAVLMLAAAVWSFGYAFELSAATLAAGIFWAKFQYIGITLIPVLWLAFVLKYTGRERWVTSRNLLLLLVIPAITMVLAWSNGAHGLIWSQVSGGPGAALNLTYGTWFWVHSAYSYVLALGGILAVLRVLSMAPRINRGQSLALLMGSLVPWLANVFYITGAGPLETLDLTPFAFTLTGLAITWGFYRYELKKILPITRISIMEAMEDGVIVVNADGRIADMNASAERTTQMRAERAIGQQIANLLPGWHDVIGKTSSSKKDYFELELGDGKNRRTFGVQVNRLEGRKDEFHGQLVVMRDISRRKEQEKEMKRLNRGLKVLSAGSRVVARAIDEIELLQDICQTIVEAGGYRMAWVGYLDESNPCKLRPIASGGLGDGYLRSSGLFMCGDPEQEEPAVRAAMTGTAVIVDDLAGSSIDAAWRNQALAHGFTSAAALPLLSEDNLIGVLTILSDETDIFRPPDVALLSELADNLVYGILLLRTRLGHRLADEALEESELKYRTLFEASNDAILVETVEGRVLDCNQPACRLFGYRREELIGLYVKDLVPAEVLESMPDLVSEEFNNQVMQLETLNQKKNGEIFLAQVSTQIAVIDGEQVIIVYVRDITTQKQVEQQIRQTAASAEIMARVAARLNARLDLNTVINAVCEETAHALDLPAVALSLYDDTGEGISQVADYGLPPEYRQEFNPISFSVTNRYAYGDSIIKVIPDVEGDPSLPNAHLYRQLNIRSCVRATLVRNGQPIGELSGYATGEPRTFSSEEIALFRSLADQAGQAIMNARLYDEAQSRLSQLQALHAVDLEITASMDLFVTLHVLLVHVTSQLEVDSAAVLLLNEDGSQLNFAAGSGFRTRPVEHALLLRSEDYAREAMREQRIVDVVDLFEGSPDMLSTLLISENGQVGLSVVPLIAKEQVKGVLEVFRYGELQNNPEWTEFLESFASLAAIAIDNGQLFNDLQNRNVELKLAYEATIEGWSRALELRDKETEGHTQRVATLTVQLAQAMGIEPEELVHIHRGALLHDMGKMAIPDSILLKPGELTAEERAIMCRHPSIANDLLSPIAYLRPALDIPYCHHEKWNGSGYPRGLKGEEIPLAARIFSVVDVWDALLSERPYRPDWSVEATYEYIRDHAGTDFDPKVVDVFLNFLEATGQLGDLNFQKVRRPHSWV